MEENNTWEFIFRKDIKLNGEFAKQSNLFSEFINSESIIPDIFTAKIISLNRYYEKELEADSTEQKLAAMSCNNGFSGFLQSDFVFNENQDIALKFDKGSDNNISATIIASSGLDLSDAIIYWKESNKYFLAENENQFHMGLFKNFDIKKFTFEILLPANKLILFNSGDSYSAFLKYPVPVIKKTTLKSGNLLIEFNEPVEFRSIVVKSNDYKDFVSHNRNIAEIPGLFLNNNLELLIY